MSTVTVTKHPELVRIINPGEDLAAFLEVSLFLMPKSLFERCILKWHALYCHYRCRRKRSSVAGSTTTCSGLDVHGPWKISHRTSRSPLLFHDHLPYANGSVLLSHALTTSAFAGL